MVTAGQQWKLAAQSPYSRRPRSAYEHGRAVRDSAQGVGGGSLQAGDSATEEDTLADAGEDSAGQCLTGLPADGSDRQAQDRSVSGEAPGDPDGGQAAAPEATAHGQEDLAGTDEGGLHGA